MGDKLANFSKRYGLGILITFHFFGVVMMAYYDLDLFASFTPGNLMLSAILVFFASAQKAGVHDKLIMNLETIKDKIFFVEKIQSKEILKQ